jgi:hypothetical protein
MVSLPFNRSSFSNVWLNTRDRAMISACPQTLASRKERHNG